MKKVSKDSVPIIGGASTAVVLNGSTYGKSLAKANRFERGFSPSKTVPDMSLSVREMYERNKVGGLTSVRPVFYSVGSNVLPENFERMDKVERAALLKALPDFIANSRGRLISAREQIKSELTQRALEQRKILLAELRQQSESVPEGV